MHLTNTPQFSILECPNAGSYFLLDSESEVEGWVANNDLLHIAPVIEHHITGKSGMSVSYWTTLTDEIKWLKKYSKRQS